MQAGFSNRTRALQWRHVNVTSSQIAHTSTRFDSIFRLTAKKYQSALLALCDGNPPIFVGFPSQRANSDESIFIIMSSCYRNFIFHTNYDNDNFDFVRSSVTFSCLWSWRSNQNCVFCHYFGPIAVNPSCELVWYTYILYGWSPKGWLSRANTAAKKEYESLVNLAGQPRCAQREQIWWTNDHGSKLL